MKFDELVTLLTPEKLPYLGGVERLADGTLQVVVLTRMPDVSPTMIGWWFGDYIRTTEHYKRWHPRDHIWMSWEDKRPGTHVGAKPVVHMVQVALPRHWGCALHSRFWLGHVASRDGSRLADAIGNAPWVRHMLARIYFGRALAVHCHEEVSTLAGFLPDSYASESRGHPERLSLTWLLFLSFLQQTEGKGQVSSLTG